MGENGFEAIVLAHHGEIYRYLLRTTARPSEAADLSQETFLRAFRAYPALPADANVRAWLFTIATNLCRNHFRAETRRRKAHAAVSADGPEVDDQGPEAATRIKEARVRIDAVIARLPLKQRLAFTLRKIHDLDYEAIGGILDCSAESARAHVFQAFRKVRQSLEQGDLARAG